MMINAQHALDFSLSSESLTALRNPVLTSFRELHGRVAIFGGTFDPVHNGHLEVARQIMQKHHFDALVFIPAAHNPLKQQQPLFSNTERLEMIALAIAEEKGMYVSNCEIRRKGESFTIDTLREISAEKDTDAELFLVIGQDSLASLPRWKEIDSIRKLVKIVPADLISTNGGKISATDIRAALANGEKPPFVCKAVERYIEKLALE